MLHLAAGFSRRKRGRLISVSILKTSGDKLSISFVPTVQTDVTQMGNVVQRFSILAEQRLHHQPNPTGAEWEEAPCSGQGQKAWAGWLPLKGPESVNLQQL